MTQETTSTKGLSPTPWSYDYNPYTLQDGRELAAFEICDANCDRIFETNEHLPYETQEANAQLAAAAPELRRALEDCLLILADYDEADNDEGAAYRQGIEALSLCTGTYPLEPTGPRSPLVRFDAYEVHGVRRYEEESDRYCEQVEDKDAQFWSLYGCLPDGEQTCIGDFKSRGAAEEVYSRITGLSYPSPETKGA